MILTLTDPKDNRMHNFVGSHVNGRRQRVIRLAAIVVLSGGLVASATATRVQAGDWPQILGPHRDGRADGEQLLQWPASGPRLIWQREVGQGFAGLAVVGERAILFHRLGNNLVAESLDTATGKATWKTSFETNYRGSISPDSGPRCVPLVHEERIYLVGPSGELACVRLGTGEKVWERNVHRDFNAPDGYFGAGSSPIVEGDKLLLNVGGRGGAGIVAFSLTDGKTIWKSTDEAASYSSPVAVALDGQRLVIFVTRLNVVAVDPQNGAVRFQFPFGQRGPTVNAANPIAIGNHLFVSASYGVGAVWAKIGPNSASTVWESNDVMSSQYTTCIEKDGVLYGIDGRQDVGVARLRAFDPQTGNVDWTEEGFGTGNLILSGDKLLIMKTDGTLVLVQPSPKTYQPLADAQLFDTTVQALPALSRGRLFVRDTKTLKCVAVGKPATSRP